MQIFDAFQRRPASSPMAVQTGARGMFGHIQNGLVQSSYRSEVKGARKAVESFPRCFTSFLPFFFQGVAPRMQPSHQSSLLLSEHTPLEALQGFFARILSNRAPIGDHLDIRP